MKPLLRLAGLVLMTAVVSPALMNAQTPPATQPPQAGEVQPTIDGIAIERGDGRWFGVTVEGVRLKLAFYDKDKKPVAADVARARARWNPVNKQGTETAMLQPEGSGLALVSTPEFRPPYVYKVYLTLLTEDGTVIDNLVIDMRELKKGEAEPAP